MSEATSQPRPEHDSQPRAEDDSQPSTECIFPVYEPMHTYIAPFLDAMVTTEEIWVLPPFPFKPLPSRDSCPGLLGRLPLELLHVILAQLDFNTLGNLRQTCSSMRLLVNSDPVYEILRKHAWGALRSLGRMIALRFYTSGDLHEVLFKKECVCGDYGPYLFVLTGERCCMFCLINNPRFAVIRSVDASHFLGPLSLKGLNKLSSFGPGRRGHGLIQWHSFWQARELSRREYGRNRYELASDPDDKWERVNEFLATAKDFPENKRILAIRMPYLASHSASYVEHGLYCRNCTLAAPSIHGVRAALLAPLKTATPPINTGYLAPMLIRLLSHIDRRKAMSRDEFYEHLSQGCKGRGHPHESHNWILLKVNKTALNLISYLFTPDVDMVSVRLAIREINDALRFYCEGEGITDENNFLTTTIPMPGTSFTI
jgi:hypothetical protein